MLLERRALGRREPARQIFARYAQNLRAFDALLHLGPDGSVVGHEPHLVHAIPILAESFTKLALKVQVAFADCIAGAARYGDAALAVIVETTVDEVVDVAVDSRGPSDLAACAADAAWAVTLPAAFDQDHATFRVASGS